ncbi:MAG TPA: cystathionine beta-synthase [Ktedonobacterales bacterium]
MRYYNSILETIGQTPLVRLNKIAQGVKPLLLAKVEYFNPGGSVKDRIGVGLIESMERSGQLKPGGTIVEPTSGNTGTGLALAAAIKGYRLICVMTDKVSEEKRSLLRAYGAEVVICPSSANHGDSDHYQTVAAQLARETPGACSPNQYENPANPLAHYRSTGPEIWEATEGKVTAFVAGVGTAGTITGTARFLKEQNSAIQIIGADPAGSIYSKDTPHPYKVEGIGTDTLPRNWDASVVDEVIRVDDRTSFSLTRRLAREEGILCGGSCGTALAAALEYAKRGGPDDVIVVLLPDTGRGYLTKIYNDTWMRENGFFDQPQHPTLADVLAFRHTSEPALPPVIGVAPADPVTAAIERFHEYGISQLPVIEDGAVVGSLTETQLLQRLAGGERLGDQRVREWQGPPLPALPETATVREAYTLFAGGQTAVAVMGEPGLRGVISKSDLMEFWARGE